MSKSRNSKYSLREIVKIYILNDYTLYIIMASLSLFFLVIVHSLVKPALMYFNSSSCSVIPIKPTVKYFFTVFLVSRFCAVSEIREN